MLQTVLCEAGGQQVLGHSAGTANSTQGRGGMRVAQHSHGTASPSHSCFSHFCLLTQTDEAVSEQLGFHLSGVELGLDSFLGQHPLEEARDRSTKFWLLCESHHFSGRERAK